MSVYDFNHNEQDQADSHSRTLMISGYHHRQQVNGIIPSTVTNATQIKTANHPQNQNDRTIANRVQLPSTQPNGNHRGTTNATSTDHAMPAQSARPTSKTALLVKKRRTMLEQLSCFLCKGYLIDATTIDECMDSFCKSCIVIHFRTHNNCPKCGVLVHKTNPFSAIRSDKVLQDIVYKMIPGLYDDEMKRRRKFYRSLFNSSSSSDSEEEEDSISSSNPRHPHLNSERYGVVPRPKPFYKLTDMIDLTLEPQTKNDGSKIYYDNKQQSIVTSFTGVIQERQHLPLFSSVDSQQFKVYLRCPAKFTTLQLKKFIAAKFNICQDDTIHLLYLNEALKDDYSLIDVAYIYDWRGIDSMRLIYIIERNITKGAIHNDHLEHPSQRVGNARISIGASTQTVKRVCIDPHPKFYQELKGDNGQPGNGRTAQLRGEGSQANNIRNVTQPPILRSTPSSSSAAKPPSPTLNGTNKPSNSKVVESRSEIAQRYQSRKTANTANYNQPDYHSRSPGASRSDISRKVDAGSSASRLTPSNVNIGSNLYQPITASPQNKFFTARNQGNNVAQVLPFVRPGFSIATQSTASVTTQSSIMTLANFTSSCNGQAVQPRPTAPSIDATDSSKRPSMAASTTTAKLTPTTATGQRLTQSSPQLAFSFVTERGITIVRRLHNPDGTPMTSSSVFGNRPLMPQSSAPTSMAPALPSSTIQRSEQIGSSSGYRTGLESMKATSSDHTITVSKDPQVSTDSSRSNMITRPAAEHSSIGNINLTHRHLTKVKPVYRTFVDPTKIKSPNLKKINHPARH